MKKVCVFEGIEEISDFAVERWKRIGKKAIKKKGVFAVCVAGGKTPVRLYQRISRLKDDVLWRYTHVFLTDERFVSVKNPDSNYFMVRRNLLKNVNIPRGNVYPVSIEKTAVLSARKYERDIKIFFNLKNGKLPKFDLAILGLGKDGHTASLFSIDDVRRGEGRIAIATEPRHFEHKRISLTLPVINNADNVMFVVTGKEKKGIAKRVLDRRSKLPASLVKGAKNRVLFLFDNIF